MFDMGWDEMLLIGAVSLVVIGPKDLPKVLRQAGVWVRKARAMAYEFQRSFEEMSREAEIDEIKNQIYQATNTAAFEKELNQAVSLEDDVQKTILPETPEPRAEPHPIHAPISPPVPPEP